MNHALAGLSLLVVAACAGTAERRAAACSAIADEYAAATSSAGACSGSCGAQRPVVERSQATRLCWKADQGYVADPAALDELLVVYGSAGCDVGSCAGPALFAVGCARNSAGGFACGGE
jgi:hypothetical protein